MRAWSATSGSATSSTGTTRLGSSTGSPAAFRGRGLATRGLIALADHAFGDLGLFRLELGHRTDNAASCRVAAKAGFAAEGIERSKLRYGDLRFDVETHARLVTDPPP